jgi:hypothetical protein
MRTLIAILAITLTLGGAHASVIQGRNFDNCLGLQSCTLGDVTINAGGGHGTLGPAGGGGVGGIGVNGTLSSFLQPSAGESLRFSFADPHIITEIWLVSLQGTSGLVDFMTGLAFGTASFSPAPITRLGFDPNAVITGITDTENWVFQNPFGSTPVTSLIIGGSYTGGFGVGLIASAPVASVPEPATLALVGVGLIGLFAANRRRRGRSERKEFTSVATQPPSPGAFFDATGEVSRPKEGPPSG